MQAQYKQQFIRNLRFEVTDLMSSMERLSRLVDEHSSTDFDTLLKTPDAGAIPPVPEDDIFLSGEHEGLSKTDYTECISAIKAVLGLTKAQKSRLYRFRYFNR